jgi:hypothetical protein
MASLFRHTQMTIDLIVLFGSSLWHRDKMALANASRWVSILPRCLFRRTVISMFMFKLDRSDQQRLLNTFTQLWIYFNTTSSNNCRQRTFAPTLAHSKNAPLNFRCNEYVSFGGGVNRCFSIVGINACTRAVTSCLEKSYTSGALTQNGSARVRIESMCALSMDYS